jgi:hypothetical protein
MKMNRSLLVVSKKKEKGMVRHKKALMPMKICPYLWKATAAGGGVFFFCGWRAEFHPCALMLEERQVLGGQSSSGATAVASEKARLAVASSAFERVNTITLGQ